MKNHTKQIVDMWKRPLTEKQHETLTYLIQEWDFGGLVKDKS